MGNGLSPLGVDVIFAPVPRLALDVQAGLLLVSNVDGPSLGGVGLAPALRAYLRAEGSSPYLALGGAFRWSTTVWTFGNGGFGNLGYEWRWPSGTRIFLGAGVAWFDPLGLDGGRSFNLELGVGRRGL